MISRRETRRGSPVQAAGPADLTGQKAWPTKPQEGRIDHGLPRAGPGLLRPRVTDRWVYEEQSGPPVRGGSGVRAGGAARFLVVMVGWL